MAFGADDRDAVSSSVDGNIEICGSLVGNRDGFYAGESRQFYGVFSEDMVRDWTDLD